MKIQDTRLNSSNVNDVQNKDEKRIHDSKESIFKDTLKQADEKNFEDKIKYLADKIFEQGVKLSKKTDIRELKVYKKLVSEFLEETINNSHKFTKKNFTDRRGRHKVFASVKKVNKELDDLTIDLLNNEKDNIKILKKLEDIRGLILDIIT